MIMLAHFEPETMSGYTDVRKQEIAHSVVIRPLSIKPATELSLISKQERLRFSEGDLILDASYCEGATVSCGDEPGCLGP